MRSVIQRLVAILMLSLLFLSAGTAVAGPELGVGSTLQVALDDGRDGSDDMNGGEAGFEASEAVTAPGASLIPRSAFCLPAQADSPLPAAPFLEGPKRPPRAA